ncbi:MAG TPA: hypothetical protein VK120_04475 [Sporosarcina sp.]|nr:hypothetical protein [Sporosarcina sp.]
MELKKYVGITSLFVDNPKNIVDIGKEFVDKASGFVGIKKYVGITSLFVDNPKNIVDIGREFVDKASEIVGIKKVCRYHEFICR